MKVCSISNKFLYEAWEHREVNIKGTIIPLIVSFVLVVAVAVLLLTLYKKYNDDVESARLRYNSS
jgi:putative effector of murein hydrolase